MAITRLGGSCLAGGVSRTMHEVCPVCGAEFERHGEHAWRLPGKSGKMRWYCSYTCMRRDERPRLEAAREREEKKRKKTELERAQERAERCRARHEQAKRRMQDAQAWDAMTPKERKRLSDTAWHWRERMIRAEQAMEDARRKEAKENDGCQAD